MRSITKATLRTFAGLAAAAALVAGGAGVAGAATVSPAAHTGASWVGQGCSYRALEHWNLNGRNKVEAVYLGTTYTYKVTFKQFGGCLTGTLTDTYYQPTAATGPPPGRPDDGELAHHGAGTAYHPRRATYPVATAIARYHCLDDHAAVQPLCRSHGRDVEQAPDLSMRPPQRAHGSYSRPSYLAGEPARSQARGTPGRV